MGLHAQVSVRASGHLRTRMTSSARALYAEFTCIPLKSRPTTWNRAQTRFGASEGGAAMAFHTSCGFRWSGEAELIIRSAQRPRGSRGARMAVRSAPDQAVPASRQRARTTHLCTLSMASESMVIPTGGVWTQPNSEPSASRPIISSTLCCQPTPASCQEIASVSVALWKLCLR